MRCLRGVLIFVTLIAAGVSPSLSAVGDESASLQRADALFRLNYEVLEIGGGKPMGLAGVHYLVEVVPDWYIGPSVFSGLYGERGGFFAGGLTAGTRRQFAPRWYLDAGMFVGGGGGGSVPDGSGLMLRPHLGISYDLGAMVLDGAVSYVRFPDGDVDSTQLSLGFGIPFELFYGSAVEAGRLVPASALGGLTMRNTEWLATWAVYHSDDPFAATSVRLTDEPLDRIGFEYRRHLDGNGYFMVETAGALGGDSGSFAELLGGVGYRAQLFDRSYVSAGVSVGGAGGGLVDTGGGLVGKARLGLEYWFSPDIKLGLEAGRMESAGSFAADFYGLSMGYRIGEVVSGSPGVAWQWGDGVRLARWRLAATAHSNPDAVRNSGDEQELGLVGLKIERFVNRTVYLTGQSFGAWDGDAGGYAVGLIGAGAELPLRDDGRLSLSMELTGGAAGGGGVDVGAGAVVQPLLGLTWRAGRNIGLRLEGGRTRALDGELDSGLIGVGLVYEFSRP